MPRKQSAVTERYNAVFPKTLRSLMNEQKVTQSALAQAVGRTRQMVSLYCDGSSSPDWQTLLSISAYFGVSVDYLLGNSVARSFDGNMRQACQFTGLSQSAVEQLHSALSVSNAGEISLQSIVSYILTSSLFRENVLPQICKAHNARYQILQRIDVPVEQLLDPNTAKRVDGDSFDPYIDHAIEYLNANSYAVISPEDMYRYAIYRAEQFMHSLFADFVVETSQRRLKEERDAAQE